MRKALLFLIMLGSFASLQAQVAPLPPFSISIEKVITPQPLPGFHSFAFAQYQDKWLVIGGRTNGLHALNPNQGFETTYANNNIEVIDTSNWQIHYSSLSNLPYSIADPLRSTNMEYFQDGDYLYMMGGYGWDSIQNKFITFNKLTSIRIDSIIDAVMNNAPISTFIRQTTNSNVKVCGGELQKVGSDFYLVQGHIFTGRYDHANQSGLSIQKYTNSVKIFTITNTGGTATAANFVERIDTNNFHRRDLNVIPIINAAGQQSLMAHAGVFQKEGDFPYYEPIEIGLNSDSVYTYQQVMSHYTCANIPIYDSVNQNMHTTFLGGISLNDYDPNTNTVITDSLVPFISDITTFTRRANGTMEECILPLQLPYLLGSNARFVMRADLPHYSNEVIKLKSISGKVLAGYMFGGIRSDAPNNSVTTVANDTIYRIYIDPQPFSAIKEQGLVRNFSVFPNPANEQVNIKFTASEKIKLTIKLINYLGRTVKEIPGTEFGSGSQELHMSTPELAAGLYYIKVTSEKGIQTFPVTIVH
jgi:hypothetical protein